MEKYYKLGRLIFKLSGDDIIFQHLSEELNAVLVPKQSFLIEFKLVKTLPEFNDFVSFPPVLTSRGKYQCSMNNFTYQVSAEGNVTLVVLKSSVPVLRFSKRILPDTIIRAMDWNYLLPSENTAKNFMYNIFDYLTQIENLKLNQSYVHASSFERNNRAVAVVAWGGIGKTTAMLKLVTEDGWKFLSDDLGIIDEDGMLYRSPKRLQIYAYNLMGEPLLSKLLLSNRSLADRLSWSIKLKTKGIKGVRRRVSAEDMFGEQGVSTSARLTDAFFIQRGSVSEFKHESITHIELARRASSTILSEVEPFNKIASAIFSGDGQSIIPTQKDLFNSTLKVLSKSFSNVNPLLITIPLKANPDDLANYLRKLLK